MVFDQMKDLGLLCDHVIESHEAATLTNFYEACSHFMAIRQNKEIHPGIIRDKKTGKLFMQITPKLLRSFLCMEKSEWVDRQLRGEENYDESSFNTERSPVRRSVSPLSKKSPNTSDASSSGSNISSGRKKTVLKKTSKVTKIESTLSRHQSSRSDYDDEPEDYHSEQDEAEDDDDREHEEMILMRKKIKQWLFGLARMYKKSKDAGIRMTELDKQSHDKFGTRDFSDLCTKIGYLHGEDAMMHIGHPQLKLAKHKTTGKV